MTGQPIVNIELEQIILGALMLNNGLLEKAPDLTDTHFYDPVHGRIFHNIRNRIEGGDLVSPVTLQLAFREDEGLMELGGTRYLARLAGAAITSGFADYVRQLHDLFVRRSLIATMTHHEGRLSVDDGTPVPKLVADLEADISTLSIETADRPLIKSFLASMTEALTQISSAYQGEDGGISTGLPMLDDKIGKLRAGDLCVLAGRPSMGKTAIALNIAIKAALRREGVMFVSLEMLGPQLVNRFYSQMLFERGVRLPYSDIRKGDLDEDAFRQICEVSKEFEWLPVVTAEPDCRSLPRLRSAVRRARSRLAAMNAPLSLIVIDYLQKIEVPKQERGYDRVSRAVNACKDLGMEYGVPVLCLSQLSRNVEMRENKRPMLADLRESGEIEQDADLVIFCYRHAFYLERAAQAESDMETKNDLLDALDKVKHKLELIVAKQRAGEIGTVNAHFQAGLNVMSEW